MGLGRDQDMPVHCIRDIEKPLYAGSTEAQQMSIASAEPDQHHGYWVDHDMFLLANLHSLAKWGVGCIGVLSLPLKPQVITPGCPQRRAMPD
jgi:hypothetical protein